MNARAIWPMISLFRPKRAEVISESLSMALPAASLSSKIPRKPRTLAFQSGLFAARDVFLENGNDLGCHTVLLCRMDVPTFT